MKVKKLLCIIISMILVFSFSGIVSFADEIDIPDYIGEDEPDVTGDVSDYDPSHVADLYLCSNWSGGISLGHVWIYIENVSPEDLEVGLCTCRPGEGISVGTFGITRSDGSGVYYNIESYCGNKYSMTHSLYLKKGISESQLKSLSKKIVSTNWWDPILFNCGFFAVTCWNKAGGSFIFPLVIFPAIIRLQMRLNSATSGLEMFFPERENVYKQKGTDGSASLSVVSDGSVDSVPG